MKQGEGQKGGAEDPPFEYCHIPNAEPIAMLLLRHIQMQIRAYGRKIDFINCFALIASCLASCVIRSFGRFPSDRRPFLMALQWCPHPAPPASPLPLLWRRGLCDDGATGGDLDKDKNYDGNGNRNALGQDAIGGPNLWLDWRAQCNVMGGSAWQQWRVRLCMM